MLEISIAFSARQFDFLNLNSNKYSLFLLGENLQKEQIQLGLNTFDIKRDKNDLKKLLKKERVLSVGLIETKMLSILRQEFQILKHKIDVKKSHFAILLEYKDSSIFYSQNNLPAEESFLISADKFSDYYKTKISTGLSYHFMLQALKSDNRPEQIFTHQIGHPNPYMPNAFNNKESAEIIIPHKGDLNDLEAALWYLKKQKTTPNKTSVCFDETVSKSHFSLADTYTDARFFVNFPSGVGPYPSRDVLARATEEEIIVFHDSDDISTTDRVKVLTDCLKTENIDAVGSHELRVNKIEKRIEAIRYPLNVTEMEKIKIWHRILFPTTAISKTAYLKAGGLSTVRKHSSDSQFYWRAHFFLNIKNIDEFLYIRIKRENSLTTASSTALGSAVRERLKRQWRLDFVKVQSQNISLRESSLIDENNVAKINLIPLKVEFRKTILDWQELNESLQKYNPFYQLKEATFPDEEDILENRILDYKRVKDLNVSQLKQSFSWKIGWAITRAIIFLFGWIPFVKKKI